MPNSSKIQEKQMKKDLKVEKDYSSRITVQKYSLGIRRGGEGRAS
jgi:hypothetical protein